LAIGFLFASALISKEPDAAVSTKVKSYFDFAYLFLGTFSFLLTLALPRTLGKIQLARSEAEIEARRAAAGIQAESGRDS
jgi:hypothetical protein